MNSISEADAFDANVRALGAGAAEELLQRARAEVDELKRQGYPVGVLMRILAGVPAAPIPLGRIEAAQRAAEAYADRHRDEFGVTNRVGGMLLQLVDIIESLKFGTRGPDSEVVAEAEAWLAARLRDPNRQFCTPACPSGEHEYELGGVELLVSRLIASRPEIEFDEEQLAAVIARSMPGWNDDTSEPDLEGPPRTAAEEHWQRVNDECLRQGRVYAHAALEQKDTWIRGGAS